MDKKNFKDKGFSVVALCGHLISTGVTTTRRSAEKIASYWENGHPGQFYRVVELVEKGVSNG